MSASVHAGIHPPGQTPPTATAADGRHPTGMLSCNLYLHKVSLQYHDEKLIETTTLQFVQGSHSDWKTWKTWKNGKAFSSQGKVREF